MAIIANISAAGNIFIETIFTIDIARFAHWLNEKLAGAHPLTSILPTFLSPEIRDAASLLESIGSS